MNVRSALFVGLLLGTCVALPSGAVHAQSSEGAPAPSAKLFYWLQAGLLRDEDGDENTTFQLKRARFGLSGKALSDVGFHLMVEGIHGGFEPKVYQAWIRYAIHPLADVRVGQFKYPFGVDAYPRFTRWKFVNPAYVTGGVVKEMGRRTPSEESGLYRDIGVELSGGHQLSRALTGSYRLMVMNGNGILKADNNEEKDLVVQGVLDVAGGPEIGASFYRGFFDDAADSAAAPSREETAIGLHMIWGRKIAGRAVRIQGEYIAATYESGGGDIKPWGFYAYATAFVLPPIELGIRYDFFEQNREAPTKVERRRTTLQTSYYMGDDQKISVNYEIMDHEPASEDNLLTVLFQASL